MEIDNKKVLISAIIVALVVLVSFNFEKMTGQATATGKVPTTITTTSGVSSNYGVVYGNSQVSLVLRNSFPSQQVRIYGLIGNTATSLYLTAKDCEPMGVKSTNEYICTATKYIGKGDLRDGKEYYFKAESRYGVKEGNKLTFTYVE